jgi:putative transposase
MPRPHRIEIPGVPLHIVQRGNNRNACFFGEIDRHFYLKCLGELARLRNCAVHAYALMTNHVHLLVTPGAPGAASALMQDLGRRYVRVVNEAHSRTGTLWEGRFKSNLVDSERYLMICHRYIELNPVRAGIVVDLADYPWSSHHHYSRGKPSPLISEHEAYLRLGTDANSRQQAFRALFEQALGEAELKKLRTAVNKGWALGSEQFVDRMEAIAGDGVRPARRGRPRNKKEVDGTELPPQPDLLL